MGKFLVARNDDIVVKASKDWPKQTELLAYLTLCAVPFDGRTPGLECNTQSKVS
jgi:hypothetical protein